MKQLDDQAKSRTVKPNQSGYINVTLPQIHKLYKKDDRRKQEAIESVVDFREVMEFMFTEIWNEIFKNGWIFHAPARFGQFYVKEVETSTKADAGFYIDWVATKKKGKIVKQYNLHTGGRAFYIKWSKILCKLHNKSIYRFAPFRGDAAEFTGSRGLTAWIKKCSEDPKVPDFRGHMI